MMSIPEYITANVVSLFWSKIFYCLPMFVICAISTLCNISIRSIWLCLSTCCLTHFLGLKNFTIFHSFHSFLNLTVSSCALWTCWLTYFFRVRLCPFDLLFHPFFWGQQILLFLPVFAVFLIFAVSSYAV